MAENKKTFLSAKITILGVGPKIILATALFSIPVIYINKVYFSRLKLVILSPAFTFFLSLALAAAGAVFLLWSMAVLLKWRSKGELATTGPYSVTRNPIYAGWIYLILPGIIVNLQSPFLFFIPVFMHKICGYFITREEEELEEMFGDEFLRYKEAVPRLFPKFWLYKGRKAVLLPGEKEARERKRAVAGLFDRAAPMYDRVGPRFFAYFGRRLVEEAGVGPGAAVLDVASGRGASLIPAAEAAGKDGYVIGIDLSPAMVREAARQISARFIKNAEAQRMDAERLSFADGTFNTVLGGFCVFFFHDPERALREFHRVLRPGGKLALSTWGEYETRDWHRELARKYCESNPLAQLTGKRFDKPEELGEILDKTGFFNIAVKEESRDFLYKTPEEWWQTQYSHGIRAVLEHIELVAGAEGLESFKREAFGFFEARRGPEGFTQSMRTLYATATK
jgi:ubiquinone/menaquinone biosynthesis C-methylase UbiE/protein-S-isoprenylcysteine O-methyltransferase Ste14